MGLSVEDRMMLIFAVLVFTTRLAPSLAQNNVADLQALVSNLVVQAQDLQNQANVVARTTTDANRAAGNQVVVCDYVISSGQQAGPRTWTTTGTPTPPPTQRRPHSTREPASSLHPWPATTRSAQTPGDPRVKRKEREYNMRII